MYVHNVRVRGGEGVSTYMINTHKLADARTGKKRAYMHYLFVNVWLHFHIYYSHTYVTSVICAIQVSLHHTIHSLTHSHTLSLPLSYNTYIYIYMHI